MRPALAFAAVSAVYAAGALLAAVALMRVLDPLLMPATPGTAGESVAWLLAWLAATVAAAVVAWYAHGIAEAECQFTRRAVACQAQRNASTIAVALLLLASVSLALSILMLAGVVHARDALTVMATLSGPVATVWYWAATLPYLRVDRVPDPVSVPAAGKAD